ncbi:MAG: M20/M25/M40 family metallo-hydrolase [Alphaproteobacteria bacterium]|nr:M20/M25/M40 family metallo-hydrolase [Alphaproteobacteria bacterium]
MGTLRAWCLGLLAVGIWCLSVYGTGPSPLPSDAPASEFSAARANATLARLLGPERPHPVGSPEATVFRERLKAELTRLGVPFEEQTGQSCYGHGRWRACATVTNIHAVALSGEGPEVLLMAHTDSNPRGPGAADDGSGVAIILETIRALKARAIKPVHPVAALFTDGEEKCLCGAVSYAANAASVARTGAVVNVEARGSQGASLLFQTSPGDAKLIDLYAGGAPYPATSSLYPEIYRALPNDTDLTPFLAAGVPGVNFAFLGEMRNYHSPTDRRANLSLRSLQHQGDNVLSMAGALATADFSTLKDSNAIYLDIFHRWLPRLPQAWAVPLALAAFLMIALAGYFSRRDRRTPHPVLASMAPLLLLLLCVVAGFVLYAPLAFAGAPTLHAANPVLQAALVATGVGGAWPSNPLWLRLALALGVWAAALWTVRWAGPIACWLWFAGLAVVSALWLPGLSPYFLFPSLVAAPLLLLTLRGGRGIALFIAALAGLVVWVGFTAGAEDIEGLRAHLLFTLPAGFALLSLLPLLAGRRLGGSAFASAVLALIFAVAAGLTVA